MILYNGATGSLGQYFGAAAAARNLAAFAVDARLSDRDGLARELSAHAPALGRGLRVTWVQMAAKVPVQDCERAPEQAHEVNVVDTAASVEQFAAWASAQGARPRVVFVSSGHVYAPVEPGTRLTEAHPVEPRSVYARTKLLAEETLRRLCASAGLPLVVARVFGLIAPRQPASYVLPGMLRRARNGPLRDVPGLDCVRDYLDSRDVCAALVELCRLDADDQHLNLVNVCSGEPLSLRQMLEEAIRQTRSPDELAGAIASICGAPGRPDDVPWIVGDPGRLVRLLGGSPKHIALRETIFDALRGS